MFETGTTTDSERLIMNTLVAQNQCIECNQSHDVRDDPGDEVPICVNNIFVNCQRNLTSTKVFLYKSNLLYSSYSSTHLQLNMFCQSNIMDHSLAAYMIILQNLEITAMYIIIQFNGEFLSLIAVFVWLLSSTNPDTYCY